VPRICLSEGLNLHSGWGPGPALGVRALGGSRGSRVQCPLKLLGFGSGKVARRLLFEYILDNIQGDSKNT
tara:strand:- start:620 stop:829 length:210 start_codon:yes stop_codon:yes gene_type:complete